MQADDADRALSPAHDQPVMTAGQTLRNETGQREACGEIGTPAHSRSRTGRALHARQRMLRERGGDQDEATYVDDRGHGVPPEAVADRADGFVSGREARRPHATDRA